MASKYLDDIGLAYLWGKIKGWVNSSDANVVHRTGDEIIQGVKTLQNTASGYNAGDTVTDLVIRNPQVTRGTPIEGGRSWTRVIFADAEGDTEETFAGRLGLLEVHSPKENDIIGEQLNLRCYKYSGESADYSKTASLAVGYDINEIPYAAAPATSDDRTNSTDIVTRGYMEASEWNWQKTKKNAFVQFKPVSESDLEPVVDFMFTETPPASGEKGPSNPSTISGVSNVKLTRCGKNLCPIDNIFTENITGLTVSTNTADGYISISGTASSNGSVYIRTETGNNNFLAYSAVQRGKTYKFSLVGDAPAGVALKLFIKEVGESSYATRVNITSGNSVAYTIPTYADRAMLRLDIASGTQLNCKCYIQVEEGDFTTVFEPYLDNDYTIQLGDTYYGGSLDVATGVMTVTHYYRILPTSLATDPLPSDYNFATGRIWPSNFTDFIEEYGYVPRPANPIVCDKLPTYTGGGYTTDCISLGTYNAANQTSPINITLTRSTLGLGSGDISANDVRAAMVSWISSNNPIVVYPLHTPYTIQLTPIQIRSLPALDKYEPRINTVYTDQEAVQVGYQRYANYVDLTTRQDIFGRKVFRQAVTINTDSNNSPLASLVIASIDSQCVRIGAENYGNSTHGAMLTLYSKSTSSEAAGEFVLHATNTSYSKSLIGKPDGTLTWNNNDITGDVHTTGNETIGGIKTFTSEIHLQNINISVNSAPTNNRFINLFFTDNSNVSLGRILYYSNSSSNGSRRGCSFDLVDSSNTNRTVFSYSMALNGTDGAVSVGANITKFHPTAAGCTLGANSTTQRWGQIYSSVTTISTSDERVKTEIANVPDKVLDCWENISWVQFKMIDSVKEKGNSARLHNGMIAQNIKSAFESSGLDASRYGLFCYDEWDEEQSTYDDKGNITQQGQEAGNLYSLRYEEALCMEAAYMRRENARLKKRIADLEERLEALELLLKS